MYAGSLTSWVIVAASLTLFAFIGLRAGRGIAREDEDFLTGGRNFSAPVIALSLFATSNSGFMLIGAVGAGYSQGISVVWLMIAFLLGEILFWRYFPARINRTAHERGSVTIPDYIAYDLPHGGRLVRALAGTVVLLCMLAYFLSQLTSIAKATAIGGGIAYEQAALISGGALSLVVLVYCVKGGLRASIMVNAAQGLFLVLLTGVFVAYPLVLLGGPAAAISAVLVRKPDAFDLFAINPPLLTLFFFLGGAVASFGSSLGLPTTLSRIAAAKDNRALRGAKWWYLGIAYGFWFLMSMLGLLMVAAVPEAGDPETSLFRFFGAQSPVMLGLLLAGVLALILSTTDGLAMVGGSALSDDIADAAARAPRQRSYLRLTGLLLFVGTGFGLSLAFQETSVFEVVLLAIAGLAGGIGPAFMIRTLGWRTSGMALAAAIPIGFAASVIWSIAGFSTWMNEALPGFAAGIAMHWLVIRLSRSAGRQMETA